MKDLSAKVKGLLKESRIHEHNTDILLLKKTNADMKSMIDQFKSKVTVPKNKNKE